MPTPSTKLACYDGSRLPKEEEDSVFRLRQYIDRKRQDTRHTSYVIRRRGWARGTIVFLTFALFCARKQCT